VPSAVDQSAISTTFSESRHARACFGQTDSERFQQIKGFSGDHLKQSLPGLILFWSPSNAKLLFC
jgi:hypothetical protein